MAGQSSYNRLLSFEFWRDFSSTTYVFSLIALAGYGIGMEKPAATNSALAMGLWSVSRFATQKISERPLNRTIANLQTENYEANAAVLTLREALEQNWGWHEKYKELEHQQQVAQNQVKELEQSCESIRLKWQGAESLNTDFQIEEAKWKAKFDEMHRPCQAESNRLQQAVKHYQAEYKRAVDDYNAAIERNAELTAQVEYLKLQVQALLAPKKLAEGTDTNNFSGLVVDWFAKIQPAIILDAESADVSGSDWVLVFRLRNRRDGNRVREFATAMKIDFSLAETPSFKINEDKLRMTIYRGEKNNESKYLKVDPLWLREALVFEKSGKTVTHHARFSGSTETGKSTLVSNAVGCIIQNIPLIQVQLADPLKNGQSEWKTLKPAFKGEEACIKGLMDFYEEFQRLDQGLETSDIPKVFILDEFDRMMAKYPELQPIVLDLWKSGRHQRRYLWVLGQSVLVGKFKLNMEDVDNVVGFYLGKTVERGLADANDSPDYNARLREEWHYTKAKGIPYVCLVRPHTVSNRPFLAVMPKPGEYATGLVGESARLVEEVKEEERLDYYAEEFDLGDETVEKLNNLYNQPSEPVQPNPQNSSNPDPTTARVIDLHLKGLKPHQIVKEIWGIPASRSANYLEKKAQVEQIIRDYQSGSTQ